MFLYIFIVLGFRSVSPQVTILAVFYFVIVNLKISRIFRLTLILQMWKIYIFSGTFFNFDQQEKFSGVMWVFTINLCLTCSAVCLFGHKLNIIFLFLDINVEWTFRFIGRSVSRSAIFMRFYTFVKMKIIIFYNCVDFL